MALHFRTRLRLVIGFLVFVTVAAMTVSVAIILARDMVRQYQYMGATLTQLANRNIEYGLSLPTLLHQQIERQLIIQANSVAELVAVAESNDSITREDLSEMLERIVAGAGAMNSLSFFDEISVTDEQGRLIASTEGPDHTIEMGDEGLEQGQNFLSLLEPGAAPVRYSYQPRKLDGNHYIYVGVTGVDKPRIIQVGIGDESIQGHIKAIDVQDMLERFHLESFRRIMIITEDGELTARVEPPGEDEENASVRARVLEMGKDYLASGNPRPFLMSFKPAGGAFYDVDFGVFTRMVAHPTRPPSALFIQHNTSAGFAHIVDRVVLVVAIGSVMILLGILVGMFMSQGLSKPLLALSKGAREFGRGNLNYRIYLKRKDEFQGLAQGYNTMAISLQEYMHELEQESAQRERLESEVRIASDVQRALLPEHAPVLEGLSVTGWSQPSREVGGDFYDFIDLGDGKIGVALGDATGKGMSAALMTTECASILRTLARDIAQPRALLARTNAEFFRQIGHTHKFVTLSYIVYDKATGKATYASAGHPAPILVHGATGQAERLACEGSFPLGIDGNATYTEYEVTLEPGDVIVTYSDGFTDAQNHDAELFGEERIVSLLESVAGQPVTAITRALRESTESFMNGKEAFDDMTMVAVGYRMGNGEEG
jgi:serine phosphatase RsbU (regulator of sigma subunit)